MASATHLFSAVTPAHEIRFISCTDHSIPFPGAGMLVVCRTADFLV